MTNEFYAFDKDDADEISRVVREVRRQMGEYVPDEHHRMQGTATVVRIIGLPVSGLYPAQTVEFKPGSMWGESSGSDTPGTELPGCDWAVAAATNASDCWLILDRSDFAGTSDIGLIGKVVSAVAFGQHPLDGKDVVIRSMAACLDSSMSSGDGQDDIETVIVDICLDGVGGGTVRKVRRYVGSRLVLQEWCEAIGTCSGDLCADLPGSGSGETGTISTTCCPDNLLPETMYLTISGESSVAIVWNGTDGWVANENPVTGCGTVSVKMSCISGNFQFITAYSGSGSPTCQATFAGYVRSCDPFSITATGTLLNGGAGCTCHGSTRTFTVTP